VKRLFLIFGILILTGVLVSLFWERPSGNLAVVKIEGMILDALPTLKQFEKLKKADRVKAVVLRIDSPGGGVAASQEPHDGIRSLAEKKIVVASLGPVAASGGYYIAVPAKKILASSGTITGSIGVRMEYVNVEDLMAWLRIRPETLKSGRWKDIGSPTRAMTKDERDYLEGLLKKLHAQFKAAVAQGRGLSASIVDELAEGQVYTGQEAMSVGLIDQIGNFQEAVRVAASLAGIEGEPEVFDAPREYDRWIDRFVEGAASHFGQALWQMVEPRFLMSY